jgi:hypothetical protein
VTLVSLAVTLCMLQWAAKSLEDVTNVETFY